MQYKAQIVHAHEGRESGSRLCPIEDLGQLEDACAAIADTVFEKDRRSELCDTELTQLFCELEQALLGRRDFQHAVLAASVCLPHQDQPQHFLPLVDTPVLCAGLLTLFRFAPIPLHDHPGAYGVQRVLSGRVRIGRYDQASAEEESARVVSLGCVAVREFIAGESACYHRDRGNIHEMASLSARSVLLSMTIPPYYEQDRSWYFPVNGFLPVGHGLFSRLKKPTRVGDRRNAERPPAN